MREILFKELTSNNLRKKDTVLREVFEKDGIVARTERRCFYFIKDVMKVGDPSGLEKWINVQKREDEEGKRHFYVLKEHSDALGEDKVIFKIAGTFYAVLNETVYNIAFLHSFKVRFMKPVVPK
jgi:hypothetical protein